jgi:acyl-CoA dehydrogenase
MWGYVIVSDRSYLDWPFFEPHHAALARALDAWAADNVDGLVGDHGDVDAACRRLVTGLGEGGWLRWAAPDFDGQPGETFDLRALCLIRETLARYSALVDFAFAMQGLGTGAVVLFGSSEQRRRWGPGVRSGERIAAFALSEPEAGSEVMAMTTTASPAPGGYRLAGRKTWISNGGIADQYVVFARLADRDRATIALMVDAATPGFSIEERIEVCAPHPMATIRFDDCFVPESARIGDEGAGLKVALSTLDVFRPSVGAAALGLARRAFDEARAHASQRAMFGGRLGDLQLTQAKLAEMALDIDASALLVYRAAWAKDRAGPGVRITREAAMAKLFSTEAAQTVIDKAVQILGGLGVRVGSPVERLYREIRAMRIYEGASEVQKVVIARQLVAD